MRILILAAGFGTRLKEFGEQVPKGLIETGNTTLLGKVIADVLPLQVEIAMVTNARFIETYTQWLNEQKFNDQIQLITDFAPDPEHRLGALADILFAVDQLHWQDDDLLVLSSDTYYSFSMPEFVRFAKAKQSFALVVRKMPKDQIAGRLGCAVVEGDRIIQFTEKPEHPAGEYAAIPFYWYPQNLLTQLLEYEKAGGNMDAPSSIIPWLLERGVNVSAYVTAGETLDVGTVADVARLKTL